MTAQSRANQLKWVFVILTFYRVDRLIPPVFSIQYYGQFAPLNRGNVFNGNYPNFIKLKSNLFISDDTTSASRRFCFHFIKVL